MMKSRYGARRDAAFDIVLWLVGVALVFLVDKSMRGLTAAWNEFTAFITYFGVIGFVIFVGRLIKTLLNDAPVEIYTEMETEINVLKPRYSLEISTHPLSLPDPEDRDQKCPNVIMNVVNRGEKTINLYGVLDEFVIGKPTGQEMNIQLVLSSDKEFIKDGVLKIIPGDHGIVSVAGCSFSGGYWFIRGRINKPKDSHIDLEGVFNVIVSIYHKAEKEDDYRREIILQNLEFTKKSGLSIVDPVVRRISADEDIHSVVSSS